MVTPWVELDRVEAEGAEGRGQLRRPRLREQAGDLLGVDLDSGALTVHAQPHPTKAGSADRGLAPFDPGEEVGREGMSVADPGREAGLARLVPVRELAPFGLPTHVRLREPRLE